MNINLTTKIFKIISDVAEQNNVKVYVVGGYVRDFYLKRISKDIDFVVLGSGIKFTEKLNKILKSNKVSYFKNFGTAMIKYKDYELEFVGARKESYNRNSRKPIVEEGSLTDDLNRRDFTINAIAVSLNKNDYGKVIDLFNGLNDIKNKTIRTPLDSDVTFSDDPLRMMRAIRFATQLDFNINDKTFNSIIKNKERIKIISKERISDELNKILMSQKPSIGFILLDKCGLLDIILPELAELKGVETINGLNHKDNFLHSIQVLDNVAKVSNDLWLRWAALLHDIAKSKTKRFDKKRGWTFHAHEFYGAKMIPGIFKKLKLPLNEKMKFVQKMVSLHLRPIAITQELVTDSAVRRLLFEAGEDIDKLMVLAEADITSKNPEKVKKFLNNFKIVRQKLIEVEKKDKIRNWQPPITGDVIISTLKIEPSKIVGQIKDEIKNAILDGKIENNYESAYNYMLKLAKDFNINVSTTKDES